MRIQNKSSKRGWIIVLELSTNTKRDFINFLRGLAIFLMLWGHSIQYCCGSQFDFFENSMFKLIYSFHMPFFMLISGYLFFFSEQKRDMVELIEYKGKSLLYPILMCSLLNLLLTNGISSIRGGYSSINSIVGEIPISSLWFLWSVLICSIAMAFAMKITNKPIIQVILIIVGIPFVALFPNWGINLYMYPYFVIGYLYARNEERFQRAKPAIGIASTIIFAVMMCFFEKKHYIYTSGLFGGETIVDSLYIDFFRWAIGLFGSITVIWFSEIIYSKIKHGKLTAGIESLGKDSLAVYALSVSLLSFWLPRFSNKILNVLTWVDWNRYIWLYNLVVTPIVAIAYSYVLLLIIRGLKKVGAYRLIFGR